MNAARRMSDADATALHIATDLGAGESYVAHDLRITADPAPYGEVCPGCEGQGTADGYTRRNYPASTPYVVGPCAICDGSRRVTVVVLWDDDTRTQTWELDSIHAAACVVTMADRLSASGRLDGTAAESARARTLLLSALDRAQITAA